MDHLEKAMDLLVELIGQLTLEVSKRTNTRNYGEAGTTAMVGWLDQSTAILIRLNAAYYETLYSAPLVFPAPDDGPTEGGQA